MSPLISDSWRGVLVPSGNEKLQAVVFSPIAPSPYRQKFVLPPVSAVNGRSELALSRCAELVEAEVEVSIT